MRITAAQARYARTLRKLGPDDWSVVFRPSACRRKLHPDLPHEMVLRLIRYQRPGFRPSWLLTSLDDPQAFSRQDLVECYHSRWRMETIYREWKHALELTNLRSHTPAGLRKEVHAQLLLSNLVRWIMSEATEGHTRTPLDLSFVEALTLLKNMCVAMLWADAPGRARLYAGLLAALRRAFIRQRPGRSYPRPNDGKPRNLGRGRIRLPARLKN